MKHYLDASRPANVNKCNKKQSWLWERSEKLNSSRDRQINQGKFYFIINIVAARIHQLVSILVIAWGQWLMACCKFRFWLFYHSMHWSNFLQISVFQSALLCCVTFPVPGMTACNRRFRDFLSWRLYPTGCFTDKMNLPNPFLNPFILSASLTSCSKKLHNLITHCVKRCWN